MANFSDQQLTELIHGSLDADTQLVITEALAEDVELQQRLDQLSDSKRVASSISNYRKTPNINKEESAPEQLGDFLVLKKLGQGGMGTVYLAEDQKLKRKVAIKLISPAFRYTDKFQGQFATEAKLSAQLDHSNIVPIFSCKEQDDQPYIVMKYIEGQNLAERLKQEPSLTPEEVCRIIQQICQAIDYAHQQNLIHCDIKPSNILLDSNNKPYLSDFGISRLIHHKNEVSGTPAYQAPELLNQAHNQATDLFALGKVIQELSAHYDSPSIRALIKSLCAPDAKERKLNAYDKISPRRSNLKVCSFVFISLLAITALWFAFMPHPEEKPPEQAPVAAQSISLNKVLAEADGKKTIHLQGQYHLDEMVKLEKPLIFRADSNVTITANSQEGKNFHLYSNIDFQGITFRDLGKTLRDSLFRIHTSSTATFTDCKLIATTTEPAYQIGFPMLALTQSAKLELQNCQIECPGGIAIGSYPKGKNHSDYIRLNETNIVAEVCFFRARSAGNTFVDARKSNFRGSYLLSQNARNGFFQSNLYHCNINANLLFLPKAYPLSPSKTLHLKASASKLPETDLPWVEIVP